MNSVGRVLTIILITYTFYGCGGNADPEATEKNVDSPPKPALVGDPTLTALGSLLLSDDLAAAKAAFPAPPGSEITTEPELTLSGESHYGWSNDKQVFDAFANESGLTTLSLLKKNLSSAERHTEIDRDIERFDEPKENAEGETVAAYLWRDGDYVRIVVDFYAGNSQGILKVVGTMEALESRGFPLSNLPDLVAAFDETAVQ